MATLTATTGAAPLFRWIGSYEERLLPKEAGFGWDRDNKFWFTRNPGKALTLLRFADEAAKKALQAHQDKLNASAATDADISIPCPAGLAYLPYQRGGVAYALNIFRAGGRGALIADEMGLGKTIQLLGIINALPGEIKRALIVAPASMKDQWAAEAKKWLVEDFTIQVWTSKGPRITHQGSSDRELNIVNYDILKKLDKTLHSLRWDLIGFDEAHYLKNGKAQRTEYALNLPCQRAVMLTGTPILNRPIELWTLLNYLDPMTWRNFMGFALRYCAAFQEWVGRKQVWNFKGSSNLDELQDRLRSGVMVRRLKRDVLKDLPPKVRGLVTLETNAKVNKILAREKANWDAAVAKVGYEEAVRQMEAGGGFVFETLAADRAALAEAKIGPVLDWTHEFLESGQKLVIFAHHHILVDALAEALGDAAVVIDGRVQPSDRQALVERFQNDESCRVFIGSIGAAGIGLTLTAASHVALAELPFRPADVSQAEDRCHRYGQRDTVNVYHLLFDGSLDSDMAAMILDKQDVADSALDTDHAAVKSERIDRLTEQVAQIQATARPALQPQVEPEVIVAVHACLRILAGFDSDHAAVRNDIGFNRVDGEFGHKLAQLATLTPGQALAGKRMIQKYRRQLPDDLLRTIYPESAAA
jgi:SWI/SNF-related matrix-associated actin-dependent regulator 1 of chromatin subfamily A